MRPVFLKLMDLCLRIIIMQFCTNRSTIFHEAEQRVKIIRIRENRHILSKKCTANSLAAAASGLLKEENQRGRPRYTKITAFSADNRGK